MTDIEVVDWKDLRAELITTPEDEAAVAAYIELGEAEVRLYELRKRRGVSQEAVADAMNTSQPTVSKMERSHDVRLSTLQRYVKAMGGRLELRAVFDDETVPIA